ncbi:BMP family lipoprotein [Plantibacter sp. Mn2098]|uniref:BMP family lipoprotein n=1 Tax=Plantibacter sp. Mn2098 TaxID=3395266 RepID=UPI003BD68270
MSRPSVRRLLVIGGVALSATLLLAACSGKTATTGTTAKSDAPTIALLYGTTGDFSIMDGAYNGYTKAQKDLGFKELKLSSPNTDDYQDRINLAISQNADLAIGVGFQFAQPMTSTTKRGNTKFVDIDTDKGTTITDGTTISFAANESSYLVGVAAALTSKTKHIGFVGGVDQPSIQDFFVGFEAGAKSVDKSIQVDSTYLSPLGDFTGFSNPTKGKEAAASMYAGGADVIYAAAGGSGQGVYEQAKSSSTQASKVWAIGVDGDVYKQVDKDIQPYILTSATKNVDVAVEDVIKEYEKGDLKPGEKRYDVKSGGVGYSTSGGNLDSIESKLEAVKKQIVDGGITVPTALK